MLKRMTTAICGAFVAMLLLAACSSPGAHDNPPMTLAPHVDLDRYYGRWYIIANIPYYFEKGYVGGYVEDFKRPDGNIEEDYYAREGNFSASIEKHYPAHGYPMPGSNNAHWRMTNLWPIYLSELVLYVAPDYSYSLVGYPDRSLGWIFSRSPTMDDATYQSIMTRFAAEGYDVSQFKKVPQTSDQMGKPGFQ